MREVFLNYNEASEYRSRIADTITRDLVSMVFSALDRKIIAGQQPVGQFDVLFFVRTVEESMSSQDTLRAILNGESDLWP